MMLYYAGSAVDTYILCDVCIICMYVCCVCNIVWYVPITVEVHDQELTGQEDITLLYGIIANETVIHAYKDG